MILRKSSRISPALLAACAIFFATAPANADVKPGFDAWSAGDYKAAIKEWQGPADRGDPEAQFNMAQAYKLGRGVDQNLAKAEALYEQAAAKGHLQATDNYGLLLFQRGERATAMPFIHAASGRGDPRAQYVLGLAYFNGDNVPKDWVRAYALVSLSQQSGVSQAATALAQMDQHIPLEQRQQSALLASKLAQQAETNRASQVPATAGADYARPQSPAIAPPRPSGWIEALPPSAPKTTPRPAPAAQASAAPRPWRVQLGAFGVAANVDRLWAKLGNRPELSGRRKILVPAGRLIKLQAGGFASRAQVDATCNRLKAAGFTCIAVKD